MHWFSNYGHWTSCTRVNLLEMQILGPRSELLNQQSDFFNKRFYLFIFREKGGRKRGRETAMWERNIDWLPPACPNQGPGLQPRHVPWLGIEPVTFLFAGCCSIHWATAARAVCLNKFLVTLLCAQVGKPLLYICSRIPATGRRCFQKNPSWGGED